MKKRTFLGMELVLFELIVAILVFAVLSAVCVKIFAGARDISNKSADLSGGVIAAESAAEVFKAFAGDGEKVAEYYAAELKDGRVTLFFDGLWNPAGAEDAEFTLTIYTASGEGRYRSAFITAEAAGGRVFYSLEAAVLGEAKA